MNKKIELMAPAGDFEKLKIALLYGADAVYIGGKEYSLRANASNFDIKDIKKSCDFAHKLNKKVYVTLNIVFHNGDIKDVEGYIKKLVDCKVDALIISDLFLIPIIKKYKIDIFVSTQNSTTNIESVHLFEKLGVKRIVLARELSYKEIKEICNNTKLEVEVFVHGAMCTSYSGRCVLSNYLTNRDSNRGGCAQVCRFCFKTSKGGKKEFSMATKDLIMAKNIALLIESRVDSLKIEGRMRSSYYLATVIRSYRHLIDAYYDNKLTKELITYESNILQRVANRESTSQYFNHKANYKDQYYNGRLELSNQDFLAIIIGYDTKNKCLILEQRNYFKPFDNAIIFGPTFEDIKYKFDTIYDEDMNILDCARHPKQVIKIKYDKKLPINSMIRKIDK